jgi:hypothetical protein
VAKLRTVVKLKLAALEPGAAMLCYNRAGFIAKLRDASAAALISVSCLDRTRGSSTRPNAACMGIDRPMGRRRRRR